MRMFYIFRSLDRCITGTSKILASICRCLYKITIKLPVYSQTVFHKSSIIKVKAHMTQKVS